MKKLFVSLFFLIFCTGCFQTTAMVGPTMTLVSTGNIGHALGTFVTNSAVEKETGMQTHQLIVKKVEEQHIKQKDNVINKKLSNILESNIRQKQLVILLQNNIKKTKNIINSN
tara:strand:+ start:1918 stop:2256 length:339 start_codon:yes stop_codon:yes gene_type:complete